MAIPKHIAIVPQLLTSLMLVGSLAANVHLVDRLSSEKVRSAKYAEAYEKAKRDAAGDCGNLDCNLRGLGCEEATDREYSARVANLADRLERGVDQPTPLFVVAVCERSKPADDRDGSSNPDFHARTSVDSTGNVTRAAAQRES